MFDLVVIAPYPNRENEKDGKIQRVKAIDDIFNEKRLYINLTRRGYFIPCFRNVSSEVCEISLNLFIYFSFVVAFLIFTKPKIYIHTVVEALKVFPIFIFSRRIILDLHGVVPEEMKLGGYTIYSKLFGVIERLFYKKSYARVHVTHKMSAHFSNKYRYQGRDIIVPIFSITETSVSTIDCKHKRKPVVVYAGGIQPWQCIDEMIDFAKMNCEYFDIRFYFSDLVSFKEKYNVEDLEGRVLISTASYEEIQNELENADLGIVIRKNIKVNEVACPTKLIEYLNKSVVPIMGDCEIGDFVNLGMRYFHYKEKIDTSLIGEYANENVKVVDKLDELSKGGNLT